MSLAYGTLKKSHVSPTQLAAHFQGSSQHHNTSDMYVGFVYWMKVTEKSLLVLLKQINKHALLRVLDYSLPHHNP